MTPVFAIASVAALLPSSGDDIGLEVQNARVLHGQGVPTLVLTVRRPVSSLRVELAAEGARSVTEEVGATPAGQAVRVPLTEALGSFAYTGALAVLFADGGSGEMALAFTVEVMPPLLIDAPYERLDLAASKIEVRLSRDADRCEYTVVFDGRESRQGITSFGGAVAGTWLPVRWLRHGADDVVLQIGLTCHDTFGFYGGLDVFPWSLEVEHEDVHFATGEHVVESVEHTKLDAALEKIQTAERRYSHVIAVKLYITGHTDTVGDKASNQALSHRRALAIGRYFRAHGLGVPIFFVGRGEEDLAIPTPDETDAAANRRARYIVTVERPFAGSWQGL